MNIWFACVFVFELEFWLDFDGVLCYVLFVDKFMFIDWVVLAFFDLSEGVCFDGYNDLIWCFYLAVLIFVAWLVGSFRLVGFVVYYFVEFYCDCFGILVCYLRCFLMIIWVIGGGLICFCVLRSVFYLIVLLLF